MAVSARGLVLVFMRYLPDFFNFFGEKKKKWVGPFFRVRRG